MNLDSQVKVSLVFNVECSLIALIAKWTDGEIAELLEGDPEALDRLREEAFEYTMESEAEFEDLEIDGRSI